MQVRSIFISDVHLGTRGCQAERLLDFLKDYESENLFLVGDIIDRHEHIHVAADGKRYLVLHGDEFDQVTRYHRWLAVIGDVGYNLLVRINATLSRVRRLLKRPGYWSLAGYAKSRVKRAVSFIFDFEDSLIHAVRERGLDGVICGHIHSAALRQVGDVTYVNCGDWVDSCTAIVEHHDGRLELVRAWQPVATPLAATAAPAHPANPPAPAFDDMPLPGIACGTETLRL